MAINSYVEHGGGAALQNNVKTPRSLSECSTFVKLSAENYTPKVKSLFSHILYALYSISSHVTWVLRVVPNVRPLP
jgi:hypothetical protein